MFWGSARPAGNAAVAVLPVSLDVLDVRLPDPGKIYGIFWRVSRDPNSVMYVDDAQYRAQIRAMRELGLNALILDPFPGLEKFDESLGWIREAGFTGPIVAQEEDVEGAAAILKKHGYPPVFYGVDEPGAKTDAAYREKAERIHKGGGLVASAMRTDMARRYVEAGLIDLPILSHCYIPATRIVQRYSGPEEWVDHMKDASKFLHRLYYFQSWNDTEHGWLRLWYGFYLYRSGFDGVVPYCLMAFQKGLPWHTDWRLWKTLGDGQRVLKMFCTVYPSQEGPVPTLQWKAYGEGITDMRWIRLYESVNEQSGGALGTETLYAVLQPFFYRGQEKQTRLDVSIIPAPQPVVFEWARNCLARAIAAHLRHEPAPKIEPWPRGEPVLDVGNPEQERRSAIHLASFGEPEILGGRTCRNSDETGPGDGKAGWGSIYFPVDDYETPTRITLTVWGKSQFGGLTMNNPQTGKWATLRAVKMSGEEKWEELAFTVPPTRYDRDALLQEVGFGGGDNQVWLAEVRVEQAK